MAVADPDLQIKGNPVIQTLRAGGGGGGAKGGLQKIFFRPSGLRLV